MSESFQAKTSRMSRAREQARPGQVELSILVVNYDTVDLLRSCLESIHRHPPSVAFEVLVVDNASPDGSVSTRSCSRRRAARSER